MRRLREAMERVVQLVPTSPKLIARLKRKKKLSLSVAAVAMEAGITRVALYKSYPEIIAEIKALTERTPAPKMTTAEETNLKLRKENLTLKQSLADLISENAGLLFRVSAAEERVKALKDRISRLEARQGNGDRRLR